MNMNFMNGMFGSIQSGLCRLTLDGKIAVKTNGDYKTYDPINGTLINCDNFCFDLGDEMFFLIPTNNVQPGDIIFASKKPKYVLKVEPNILTVVNYENGAIENILPERHVFMGNTYFYGKIVSMFGNMTALNGGDGANNVMKYMMMSQMMKNMGGKSDGMSPMMMMMMFMNGGGFGNIFDGIFSSTGSAAVADEYARKSVIGKRADTSVLDEFADVKEEK